MTQHSLRAHLVDFSAPRAPKALVTPVVRDIEVEIAAARCAATEEGRLAAREEAAAECAARLAEGKAAAQAQLLEERAAWVETAGALAADAIKTAIAEAEASVAHAIAKILADIALLARKPLLIEEAVRTVTDMFRDVEVTRFEMSGPVDLVDALQARLDGLPLVARRMGETPELRLRLNQTILQSRLGDWRECLLETLDIAA